MKKYFKIIQKELILFVFLTFLSYFFYALIPYFTKLLFEGQYLTAIIGYTGSLSLFVILAYFGNITQTKYKLNFDKALKKDYFSKVTKLKYEEFSEKKVGEYISFQANDIAEIGNDYLNPMMAIITQSVRVLTVFVVIAVTLDIKVSLILICISLIGVLLPKSFGKETAKRRTSYLQHQKKYYSKIEEIFNGFKIINSRTRRNINDEHNKSLIEISNERYKYGKANGLMWALNGLGSESVNYVVFLYLGYLTFLGNITVGFAIATFQYAQGLMEPVHEILYYQSLINSSKELVKSYFDFINTDQQEKEKNVIKDFQSISVSKLNKNYETFCLRNINLKIEKNKKYALIGLNGSGKSTFLNILASHLTNFEGSIKVDGNELNEIEESFLIGSIDQEEYIFSDDFMENTTVFDSYESLTDNIFIEDAKTFINQQNCSVLSGGEKQILGLIRLVNKNTPILLLDEPVSAIDANKKEVITRKILSLNKTILMITHKIDLNLRDFDEIILFNKGELLYKLPYDQILRKKEFIAFKNNIE
ncbi:MAG: ABC transporter ATP-binding protein/permease [Firmicutes bacterium]|nr:ABC transporter ATP-binding protein/permease [Bacillota bacterium]